MTLRNELLSANAAKDQFLALLSHELRNPLSPVIAMVAALETHLADSAEVRQALDVIRRNVELEARLIDDLLDITRIAKGKLKLSLEPVSVHNVLQRALEICREDISQKALEIELNLNAHDHFVQGDPARLQQVFWNVIKNSVKFTEEGGRVSLATSNPQPGEIEIAVSDTGIGIEPDKVSKIVTPFEQGHIAYTADQAAEKARQEDFDLLISDIGLPDRSGYELMQEMRGRGVPGIALSGFGMEHDVNRARAAGFSEHLTKPINFERLEEVIQQLLGVEKR